jgi:small subunit ribosomal protein S6
MENQYSTIFVVDISQNPDEVDTVSSRIQQLIEDHGGVIKKIDRWGKRRLAYSINKNTHGFYVEIEFTANSRLNIPRILEGEYRLNDRVLRFLSYTITKKELIQRSINSGKAKAKKLEQAEKEIEKQPVVEKEAKIPASEEPIQADAPIESENLEKPESSEPEKKSEEVESIEEEKSSEEEKTFDEEKKPEKVEEESSEEENKNEKIEN